MVPIDSEEALESVEFYLCTEFTKTRDNYLDVVPTLWPSENGFLRLTHRYNLDNMFKVFVQESGASTISAVTTSSTHGQKVQFTSKPVF